MALKGDLPAADLGNLLQMSALGRRRGLLTVQDRANAAVRRRLTVDGDRIGLADEPTAPALALLVVVGRLSHDAFVAARRHASGFSGDARTYLRARAGLDDAGEAAWRLAALREEALEVFLWRDVRIALEEGDAAAQDGRPTLGLDELVMEAARRQDEHARAEALLGPTRPILRRAATAPPEGLSDVERLVFDEIDGVKGVREIVVATGLPTFHAETACAKLLDAGAVEVTPPESLPELGDRLLSERRPHDALRVWRTALRTSRLDLELHRRIANALVETGRPAKACAHWRFVAGRLAAEGRVREALDLHHLAWRLLPSRFATLESLIALLAEADGPRTREDRAALADAKRLAALFADLGETARALALAERLRAFEPEDRETQALVARLNLKLGRREAAAAAWLVLADRLAEEGDLRRALETVRTVAAFDPANAKLYELRTSDLARRMEESRRVAGRRRTRRLGLAAVAALGIWYAAYAFKGAGAVALLEARPVGTAAEAEEAAREAEELGRWYALAPAGAKARERGRAWAAAAAELREGRRRRDETEREERSARRLEAERRLAEARRLVRNGRLEDALASFRRAAEASPGRASPEAETALKEAADVERYLAEARALFAGAEALEATDPDAAYRARAAAVRDYDLAPEAASTRLAVTIESAPPGAWLVVDEGAAEGVSPLTCAVGVRGALKITARAEGCVARTVSIPLPAAERRIVVALERTPLVVADVGEPLAAAVFADEGRALVAARNGRVAAVDVATGVVRWRHVPDAIETQRAAPVLGAGGAVACCRLESGGARILDVRTGAQRGRFDADAAAVLGVADGFVVGSGSRLLHASPEGATRPLCELPGTARIDALARTETGVVWIAAGAEGLWRRGADGTLARRAAGPVASLVPDGDGVRFIRPGTGLCALDGAGTERVVAADPEASSAYDAGGGRTFVRSGPRGVLLFSGDRAVGRVALPQDAADGPPVVDPTSGRAAFALASGWISVVDFATARIVAGHAGEPGARPALLGTLYLDPREGGKLLVVRDA